MAVLEQDDRRVVGVTAEGYPIEVIAAEPERFGTELLRATGSPEYVASLGDLPDAATEVHVYTCISRPFRPPELREVDADDPPPDLLELTHVRGDLHVHTTASDGKATVEEMGRAAQELGYEYLAICDHTRNVRVVPGPRRRRHPPAGRGDRSRQRGARPVPDPARERVRHPPGRLARPSRRRARRARLGPDQPARRPALGPRRL